LATWRRRHAGHLSLQLIIVKTQNYQIHHEVDFIRFARRASSNLNRNQSMPQSRFPALFLSALLFTLSMLVATSGMCAEPPMPEGMKG
jgi:hypothetical protein